MANIESPFWLWIKGGLFVAIGCLCLVFVAMVTQSLQLVAVCCLAIWAFCRAYYFAFYVIENYIDPKFRFAGLLSVLGYFLDKDRIQTDTVSLENGHRDMLRKDVVLANAHQVWLAIGCWIVLYPYFPIQFTDLNPRTEEIGLMMQLGMYASFLGTLAFWAVFAAIPLAYRTSLFLLLVGMVGFSVDFFGNPRVETEALIAVSFYSMIVWLGFLIASTRIRAVLASCHSSNRDRVRTISIRFLFGWMCVVSLVCILLKWMPMSSFSLNNVYLAVAALTFAVPFYITMCLLLCREFFMDSSSQRRWPLLFNLAMWFAMSLACVPLFGYLFALPYDALDFEIPILLLSSCFFQVLLFLILRMAGERMIALPPRTNR